MQLSVKAQETIMQRSRLGMHRKSKSLTSVAEKKIIDVHRQGVSMESIATFLGRSFRTIREIVKSQTTTKPVFDPSQLTQADYEFGIFMKGRKFEDVNLKGRFI